MAYPCCSSTRRRKARRRTWRSRAKCSGAWKRRARRRRLRRREKRGRTMIRHKGLGRGLDALLSTTETVDAKDALQTIAVDRLQRGKYQPRTSIDDTTLDELAASIREHGVM